MNRPLVLVVDDDDDVRQALSELLRGHGTEVVEACNGMEALDVLRNRVPAVVVTDLSMPWLDGRTLVGRIRENPDLRHLPVLVMSSSREAVPHASRQLTKPCWFADVCGAVLECLRGAAPQLPRA